MKKILFSIAVLAASFTFANAQVFVKGSVGFNTKKSTTESTIPGLGQTNTLSAYNNLTIAPEIGYQIDDNIQVGLVLGYYMITEKYKTEVAENATNDNHCSVAPFIRYQLLEVGNFGIWGEAAVGLNIYGKSYYSGYGDSKSNLGFTISVLPVFTYDFSSHLTAFLNANILGAYFSTRTTKWTDATLGDRKATTNAFSIGLWNGSSLSLGLAYKF